MYKLIPLKIFLTLATVLLLGCSQDKVVRETYQPAFRQLPVESVYSRVSWSHMPKPIGPKNETRAPYLRKVISFEMPNSTLEETVVALAHSMGYEAIYSREIANRKVSLVTEGTQEEILDKICEQADVMAEIDRKDRVVKILKGATRPGLPN